MAGYTRLFASGLPPDYFLDSSRSLVCKEREEKAWTLEASREAILEIPGQVAAGRFPGGCCFPLVCNGEVRTIGRRQRKTDALQPTPQQQTGRLSEGCSVSERPERRISTEPLAGPWFSSPAEPRVPAGGGRMGWGSRQELW